MLISLRKSLLKCNLLSCLISIAQYVTLGLHSHDVNLSVDWEATMLASPWWNQTPFRKTSILKVVCLSCCRETRQNMDSHFLQTTIIWTYFGHLFDLFIAIKSSTYLFWVVAITFRMFFHSGLAVFGCIACIRVHIFKTQLRLQRFFVMLLLLRLISIVFQAERNILFWLFDSSH